MYPLLVRIFDVDFYLSAPVANLDVTFSQFRGSATHQVPVIRVFGSTDVGKKICVHIHGVFPYFYIPYDGSEPATGLMYKIASNLDKAINISLGQASSNNQHIYKVVLVSGIPFYGYHSKKHQFFKVYLYNPMLIKRVNNLLFNESVLGNIYQPHETHLNFTLQFMIDYNLHGMSNIILSQAKFRHGNGLRDNEEFVEETLSKVSSCELECDTLGEYILNRQEIDSGKLAANPGIAALWEDEKQRRRNKNEDSQLPHYLSLSKTNVPPTESHELFERALRERLAVLSQDPDKNDFNLSVYPAECPRTKSLLNCSIVDFHSPHNSQQDMSYDSELDRTLMNDTLNLTVDEDVRDLLNVLKDLEKNVVVEEDSILSQVSRNDVEDMEEEHDMSISIGTDDNLLNETINFSHICEGSGNIGDIENTTLEMRMEKEKKVERIPQLDGNCQEFEVDDSVKTIPHLREQFNDMFIELKMEQSRSCSSMNKNSKIIVRKEENNNISLDCLLKIPNQDNFDTKKKGKNKPPTKNMENRQSLTPNNSVVLQLKVLDEDVKFQEYSLQREPQDCEFKHKYPHVEECMNLQLYQPHIKEQRKSNHKIIQSIIDKEHNYFQADTIGERVSLKNCARRKKLLLKNYLEQPCELVVVANNIHLPHIAKKKRDMPSLNSDSSDSKSTHQLPTFCNWKKIKRYSMNNDNNKRKGVIKKSIVRQRFSGRREELDRNFHKKKLLVQKFCKEYEKSWNTLEKGAKPKFRVVPGYRPYVFEPIQKVVSIQTLKQSTDCIEFSSTVISNELISSYTHIGQQNVKECNLNQNENASKEVTTPISPRNNLEKRTGEHNKNVKHHVNSVKNKFLHKDSNIPSLKSLPIKTKEKTIKEKNKEEKKEGIKEKKQETIKGKKHETINEEKREMINGKKQETFKEEKQDKCEKKKQEIMKEKTSIVKTNFKCSFNKKAPALKSIEEIFKAQKKNEAQFFQSVNSIMDQCAISESKLLKSTTYSVNSITDWSRRDVLFVDGANDDSDEGDSNKWQSRSSKKARPVYSSLPIFTSARSSGRSTPIRDQTDSKKKNEAKSTLRPKIRENMKKIKRRINFDSSSHMDNEVEENHSNHTYISKPIQKSDRRKLFDNDFEKDSCQNVHDQILVKKEHDNLGNNEKTNEELERINNVKVKLEIADDSHRIISEQSRLNIDNLYPLKEEMDTQKHQDTHNIGHVGSNLSVAELYDIINNYDPQEGTSKLKQSPDKEPVISLDDAGCSSPVNSIEFEEVGLNTMDHENFEYCPDVNLTLECLTTPKEPGISPDDAGCPSIVNSIKFEEVGLNTADHENFECCPDIDLTLTPAFDVVIHSSGSISDMFSNEKEIKEEKEIISSNDSVYYKPLYKPPTRLDVIQSLSEYGIPQIRPQEPFYSNADDASGSMEIGYNLLKIKTLTSMDAQDFESSFEGIDHFRKKYYPQASGRGRKENPRYFHCPEGTCLLTPLKKPPTPKEVQNWLKQNSVPSKVVEKSQMKKSKIYFASSQDIYSDNDMSMDLTLTLSPSTPKTDTTITNTPQSNVAGMTSVSGGICMDSDVSTPTSTRSKNDSPILRTSRRKKNSSNPPTPESNVDSDTSLREDSLNGDVTLTPRSSRSGRGSPVLTKSRRRKKLDRSIILRKSALLSHSSEHSGVISGASLNNTYGFQCSVQNYQDARALVKYEYLTILSMELHVNTRGDFKPNPQYDSVQAIFYCISNDVEENTVKPRKCEGLFAINPTDEESKSSFLDGSGISCDIKYVKNELELLEEFTKFIIYWDPDILLGYEIQMLSWGYLIERCYHLGINIIPEISRVKDKHLKFNEKETGDLRVTGRVVLDLWRLLRHEIALQSYTIQSTVYEILQRRIPKYSFQDLTTWWSHQSSLFRHRTVNYYMTCVKCQLKILEQLDFVGRTSELARLFGIQFYEVLSRGSQFRVESMMLRLAKPLNYVAVSPNVQQRANMKAPEHIALVLEPESKLYTDPVIVLDFQSLYPSIIIAYNYCFSTCAGRVESLGKNTPFEFGATNLRVSKERIKYLLKRKLLNFSPCGVAFVKKSVRDGIMPRMLREILDTRLMVKKSMKENKEDAVLQKVLHSRQLGLKLIANVTYGYTAANFSGRMPSVELGDSIVSKARETLQRTISLVDNNKEWGVRVVYGDTDSLFVHCPGKSRTEAFAIGEQIVEAVGKENPDPVKLKLEKVYQPCILQTKKRYVGYMYEGPDQKEPSYDAKGIETVRRDGCPAVAKMLEKTLRILFETKDVSKVKEYCLNQFNKIILGRISIKDLTFAKEFRGLTGYRPGACVPSLELAKRWVAVDSRAEPRRGERVPYVIINGPPGLPLIRSVRSPHELLKDPALKPNALYYITRVIIPPLNRCFNLIGADLQHWFLQMPRKQLHYLPTATSPTKRSTISQYFVSTLCAVCGTQTQNGLCDICREKPQETVTILNDRARQWEASYNNCKLICCSCTQILDNPGCISLDCPVLYRLNQTGRDLQQADHIRHLLSQYFDIF